MGGIVGNYFHRGPILQDCKILKIDRNKLKIPLPPFGGKGSNKKNCETHYRGKGFLLGLLYVSTMFSIVPDPTIHHPPSTVLHPPSTIYHPLSTIRYPLSTIIHYHPLSTVHYPLSIHYPLSTVHCHLSLATPLSLVTCILLLVTCL